MDPELIARLSPEHRRRLDWFEEHQGEVSGIPGPLTDGLPVWLGRLELAPPWRLAAAPPRTDTLDGGQVWPHPPTAEQVVLQSRIPRLSPVSLATSRRSRWSARSEARTYDLDLRGAPATRWTPRKPRDEARSERQPTVRWGRRKPPHRSQMEPPKPPVSIAWRAHCRTASPSVGREPLAKAEGILVRRRFGDANVSGTSHERRRHIAGHHLRGWRKPRLE
jgi:hypothetical protein